MAFLDRSRVGLIMRAFSSRESLVESTVEKVRNALQTAVSLVVEGQALFRRISILVPMNQKFEDSDCQATLPALQEMIWVPSKTEDQVRIEVIGTRGDVFCSTLNYGVAHHLRSRIDCSVIMSPEASSYLTRENMEAMVDAFYDGAKVAGLALEELATSVLEGRIANTFAMWDNVALVEVGGFDLMARKGLVGEHRPNAGVEEIPPLIRLVELHGACIAPIKPTVAGEWSPPDKLTNPEGYERHLKKMRSKYDRQLAHARTLGRDLDFVKHGVIQEYRDPSLY